MNRGKHDRGYLENLHRTERRRNTIWGAVIGIVLIAGLGVILHSALGSGDDSERNAESSDSSPSAAASAPAASEQDAPSQAQTEASSASASDEAGADSGSAASSATDATQTAAAADTSLAGFTICIDAGHCANPDSTPSPNNPDANKSTDIATEPGGTSGAVSGPEYKICLLVAKQLEKDYEAAGATVVMVRTANDVSPISPKNRALIANEAHADAFVRLHCDSAGSAAHGFYTLVPANTGYQAEGELYKKSQKMGRFMHKRIVKQLGANDRGVTVRSDQGGFNWCKVPCVLFEMANMANASDDEKLATKSYRAKLARAICDATIAWFA